MKKRFTYRLRRVRVNAFFMIFCMSCQHSKSTFAIKRDIAKSLLVFEKKCLPLRTLLLNITPRGGTHGWARPLLLLIIVIMRHAQNFLVFGWFQLLFSARPRILGTS